MSYGYADDDDFMYGMLVALGHGTALGDRIALGMGLHGPCVAWIGRGALRVGFA